MIDLRKPSRWKPYPGLVAFRCTVCGAITPYHCDWQGEGLVLCATHRHPDEIAHYLAERERKRASASETLADAVAHLEVELADLRRLVERLGKLPKKEDPDG